MAKRLVAVTIRNGVLFCTLHMGSQSPGSLATEEDAKINEQRQKISVPENMMTTYPAVLAFFPLKVFGIYGYLFQHFLCGSHENFALQDIQPRELLRKHRLWRGRSMRGSTIISMEGRHAAPRFCSSGEPKERSRLQHKPLFLTVIGQCKVIAITLLIGSEDLRVNDFNCTMFWYDCLLKCYNTQVHKINQTVVFIIGVLWKYIRNGSCPLVDTIITCSSGEVEDFSYYWAHLLYRTKHLKEIS